MAARAKIDLDRLREMIRRGMYAVEITAAFDVSHDAVRKCCLANNIALPQRKPRSLRLPGDPPRATTPGLTIAASQSTDPRTASLMATGGRYADLAAVAQAQGVTEVQARQAWHRH